MYRSGGTELEATQRDGADMTNVICLLEWHHSVRSIISRQNVYCCNAALNFRNVLPSHRLIVKWDMVVLEIYSHVYGLHVMYDTAESRTLFKLNVGRLIETMSPPLQSTW